MKRLLLLGLVATLSLPVWPARGRVEAPQSWTSNYFSSPSGNIRCREFVKRNLMACLTLNDNFAVIVPLYGKSRKQRNVGALQFPRGPTLYYGEKWRGGGRGRGEAECVGGG